MRSDERAIDTVFGALILILVCFISSSFLLSHSFAGGRSLDTDGLEKRFDCILSSTVDAIYTYDGKSVTKSIRLMDYLLELSMSSGQPKGIEPINDMTKDITSIVDFYLRAFDGWTLTLSGSYDEPLEVASRAPASLHDVGIVVLERIIPSVGQVDSKVSLSVAE